MLSLPDKHEYMVWIHRLRLADKMMYAVVSVNIFDNFFDYIT